MNPFEKNPGAGDNGASDEDIKKVRENLNNPISDEQKILLDKLAVAEDQIREERGEHFFKLSASEASALIAKRAVENDESLQKEIDEMVRES